MLNKPANNLNKFLITHKKIIDISIISCLFAMLVTIITATYTYNLRDNGYKLLNNIIYALVIFFSLILFVSCISAENRNDIKSRLFFSMLVTNCFISFLYAYADIFAGSASHANTIFIFTTLGMFFGSLCYCSLCFYYREFFPYPQRNSKIFFILNFSFTAICNFILILNFFMRNIFYVNDEGFCVYLNSYVALHSLYIILISLYTFHIIKSKNTLKIKISLICYSLFYVAVIFFDAFASTIKFEEGFNSFIPLGIMSSLFVIFFNVYVEEKKEMIRQRADYAELQSAIMLSQIQPHFLYNSLAVISALCKQKPDLAETATNTFADYLRQNMDSLTRRTPITFDTELQHIRCYVLLEELRFEEKLNVEYEIHETGFLVPPLSVQPIVENAIKHGICNKDDGGKVVISTSKHNGCHIICVEDDGIGFDVAQKISIEKKHIGIENVRNRLQIMVNGSLSVESKIGKGTKVIISIPCHSKII